MAIQFFHWLVCSTCVSWGHCIAAFQLLSGPILLNRGRLSLLFSKRAEPIFRLGSQHLVRIVRAPKSFLQWNLRWVCINLVVAVGNILSHCYIVSTTSTRSTKPFPVCSETAEVTTDAAIQEPDEQNESRYHLTFCPLIWWGLTFCHQWPSWV